MKVVCINKDKSVGESSSPSLTIGKIYDVMEEKLLSDGNRYLLFPDEGKSRLYYSHRFKLLSEHRENKINEILQ